MTGFGREVAAPAGQWRLSGAILSYLVIRAKGGDYAGDPSLVRGNTDLLRNGCRLRRSDHGTHTSEDFR